jgi:hypothetical protein
MSVVSRPSAIERPERRAVTRFEIMAAVTCDVGSRLFDALSYDLSTDGCMIQCPNASLSNGELIKLCFPGQEPVEGRVAWAKHRNAGVQFSQRLEGAILSQIVQSCDRAHRARIGSFEPVPRAPVVCLDYSSAAGRSGVTSALGEARKIASTAEYLILLAVFAYGSLLLVS